MLVVVRIAEFEELAEILLLEIRSEGCISLCILEKQDIRPNARIADLFPTHALRDLVLENLPVFARVEMVVWKMRGVVRTEVVKQFSVPALEIIHIAEDLPKAVLVEAGLFEESHVVLCDDEVVPWRVFEDQLFQERVGSVWLGFADCGDFLAEIASELGWVAGG